MFLLVRAAGRDSRDDDIGGGDTEEGGGVECCVTAGKDIDSSIIPPPAPWQLDHGVGCGASKTGMRVTALVTDGSRPSSLMTEGAETDRYIFI